MKTPRSYALLISAILSAWFMLHAGNMHVSENVAPLRYLTYQNFRQRTSSEHIRSITMGKDGTLWLGTMSGLFTFDGYDMRKAASENIRGIVYCQEIQGDQHLLGCEDGLFSLNISTGKATKVPGEHTGDVLCMTPFKGNIYIGSSDGLYVYDTWEKTIHKAPVHDGKIPQNIISLSGADDYLYIGGMKSIGKYDVKKGSYETISDDIILAGAMLVEGDRLWIGTARNLMSVGLADGKTEKSENLPVVKAINRDAAGNLLLGTDAGLYVRSRNGVTSRISHNAFDMNSLAGESVWDIYIDDLDNVWLATERGLSMSYGTTGAVTYPLPLLTGSVFGNSIECIIRDSEGIIWAGGNNGLIRINDLFSNRPESIWYRNEAMNFPVAHNRVRAIYESRDGKIWTATDVGVASICKSSGKVTSYTAEGESFWTYDVVEDSLNRIWIAGYSGVYCIEPTEEGGEVKPLKHIGRNEGLASDRVSKLWFDSKGKLWTLSGGKLCRTDTSTLATRQFILTHSSGEMVTKAVEHSEGTAWALVGDTLFSIGQDDRVKQIVLGIKNGGNVTDMKRVDDEVWLTYSHLLVKVNFNNGDVRQFYSDNMYRTFYNDTIKDQIIFGGDDLITSVDSRKRPFMRVFPLKITGITVNDTMHVSPEELKGNLLRMPHNKNNIIVRFSDFVYANKVFSGLRYRISHNGKPGEWISLGRYENYIKLTSLSPGKYDIFVEHVGQAPGAEPLLRIDIRSPWYASGLAYTAYALILFCIIATGIFFYITRKNLKKERETRAILLEEGESKRRFMTIMTRDLKNPLSTLLTVNRRLDILARDSESKRLIGTADETVNSLMNMISNSLEIYSSSVPLQISENTREIADPDLEDEDDSHVPTDNEQDNDAVWLAVIVENNASAASAMAEMLRGSFHCVIASDGNEGIRLCKEMEPDIVVTEYNIDGLNGLRMAAAMKKDNSLTTIPVIMLTGDNTPSLEMKSISAGIDVFMKKPIDYAVLRSKMIALVERVNVIRRHVRLDKMLSGTVPDSIDGDEKIMKRISRIIEMEISNPELSVNYLVDKTGLSEKKIYRLIKEHVGVSTSEFIRKMRLAQASSLLKSKKFTVGEVMYMCGFQNASYFSRSFKKEFGTTPREYAIHQ